MNSDTEISFVSEAKLIVLAVDGGMGKGSAFYTCVIVHKRTVFSVLLFCGNFHHIFTKKYGKAIHKR